MRYSCLDEWSFSKMSPSSGSNTAPKGWVALSSRPLSPERRRARGCCAQLTVDKGEESWKGWGSWARKRNFLKVMMTRTSRRAGGFRKRGERERDGRCLVCDQRREVGSLRCPFHSLEWRWCGLCDTVARYDHTIPRVFLSASGASLAPF